MNGLEPRMNESTLKKLKILAESAKYDAACTSSGVGRPNSTGTPGGVGSAAAWGCCHSFSEDGRCISLLKILFTNHCIYDCAYCINRRSNDLPRTAFGVRELAELTIEFYRRNYIEGLFLSSGVLRSPDHTMELIVRSLRELRTTYRFNGYIHVKCIPGADAGMIRQAGLLADRLSVNIEIPSESNLKRLAPEKDHQSVYKPMYHICKGVLENREERKKFRSAPRFAPAGQSTQMIVGASDECDRDILLLSSRLYQGPALKRVFYSGFVPVNAYDNRLPALKVVPLLRENRLYQADWLMRFYGFAAGEILDESQPDLDLQVDPKIAWALRHPEFFPLDVNRAEYSEILRVPGIGLRSAQRIVQARRYNRVTPEHMKRMGVVMSRARFFLAGLSGPAVQIFKSNAWDNLPGLRCGTIQELGPDYVRLALLEQMKRGRDKKTAKPSAQEQFSLFGAGGAAPVREARLALPV